MKKQRRIPDIWKTAAVTPIHRMGDRRYVQNYHPMSLLDTESKILEKCIYVALYDHFATFLTTHQHGFVKSRSVFTNMITFPKKIHDTIDSGPNSEVIEFCRDFSKAFDKVPHFELIKSLQGCLLRVLMEYLSNRKEFIRIDNTCSGVRNVNSGVPQGSLFVPNLFCIFINDIPDARAEVLRPIHLRRRPENPRDWKRSLDHPGRPRQHCKVGQIKPDGAGTGQMCSDNILREKWNFDNVGEDLAKADTVKDLGFHIKDDLSWSKHIEERLRKANKVLYLLRRNVAVQVKPLIKLGLYKSQILPVLLYGFTCTNPSWGELQNLECFQKKAVKWITGNKGMNYISQFWLLNILSLPMSLQVNDLFLLAKFMHEKSHCIKQPDLTSANGRTEEVFWLQKTRAEKTRSEFTFRNCRLANR